MKNVIVRNLDENVIGAFKEEAKRRGVSLQAILKQTINDNAPQKAKTIDKIMQEIDALRAKTKPAGDNSNMLDIIHEGRDDNSDKLARIYKW